MPVEIDAPECRRLPLITWGLALICILVFALTVSDLREIVNTWGFIPAEWSRKYGFTIFSSMFLHGGVWHLVGNLYFLLIFGDNVEDEFGKFKYILLIIASGVCAVACHTLFDPRTMTPCIGASGFISGVIAAYAICFPQAKLSFLLLSRSLITSLIFRRCWFSLPAWGAFAIWIILQILMASQLHSLGGGVAYLAHIGGALPGLIYAIWYRLKRNSSSAE